MPELPEVETTLQGVRPYLQGQKIQSVTIRHPKLRWPIPAELNTLVSGQVITELQRRGKYLLLKTPRGTVILHLGMSGRLGIFQLNTPAKKHDHIDFIFSKYLLRLTDPRRFGACLWTTENPEKHFLLENLGVEPFSKTFSGNYLFQKSRKRKIPVKSFIMNSQIVVGVGNIYAAESLFAAKINPFKSAEKISLAEYQQLALAIKKILKQAIKKGGTTLKDFLNSEGKPGYFSLKLKVYGRENQACMICKKTLRLKKLSQRATVYCEVCQK